ncbi:hypothetical protein CQA53_06100 [Helicobacter didelphidarum]|uniref:Anti-sigma-28 factor FlgM C-terminal domain-containing protein n=1 Tax=Helicobacter didelphidarum TaxID=2040648 RepID=A0A3D8IL28_9HELI|nr:flagellar biosynthesis anti-sigma factor FlgM [Helicobacter didelphidarum]RDU65730.1 hypothetical protein CQA53_06100 [Helicobacter didelphidarum]
MRIASSVTASIQQAQTRERNDINRNDEKRLQEKDIFNMFSDKSHADRVARIKEEIRSGTYKIDLMATSDKMAQSLLNV